jgi:hypothetical protein
MNNGVRIGCGSIGSSLDAVQLDPDWMRLNYICFKCGSIGSGQDAVQLDPNPGMPKLSPKLEKI